MSLRSLLCGAATVALLGQRAAADCASFGMDFQDGGLYFQNNASTDPFSFVSQFEGCNNDTAYNILTDPNGDQTLCSNTNLTPDDTNQVATCPNLKDELWSGEWSVIIISNNADSDDQVAFQRDFSLNVGSQVTTTTTPTIIVSTTTTPVASVTTTTTLISTLSAATPTTTIPSTTITKTIKVTPAKVTISTTSTLYTITKVKAKVSVVKVTTTVTPSCKLPVRATTTDKPCSISITVAGVPTAKAKPKMRFAKDKRSVELLDKESFLRERRAFLEARHMFEKRAPDAATLTITDTNTADYPTVTSTQTDATFTATYVITTTTSTTVTPTPVTVIKGKTTAPAVTTTLPTPTRTVRKFTIITTTVSTTYYPTVTITKKTTPADIKAACKTAGGILV